LQRIDVTTLRLFSNPDDRNTINEEAQSIVYAALEELASGDGSTNLTD
jgi:hypothetical protein